MATEAQKLRLFERVRQQTGWLIRAPDRRNDVTQEAWILALEYAQKRGRLLDSLSNTELKYRCLEAARKVMAYPQEISVTDLAENTYGPGEQMTTEELTENLIQGVMPKKRTLNAARIKWVLRHHPCLKLTERQLQIFSLLQNNYKKNWRAQFSQAHNITSQSISNTIKVLKKKVEAALDLVRLWDGDIYPFFEKYSQGWATSPLINILWSVLRPTVGTEIPARMYQYFSQLQKPILQTARSVLEKQIQATTSGGRPDIKQLNLAYNLLISGLHIDPQSPSAIGTVDEINSLISPKTPWVIYRFIRRANHLVADDAREGHGAWLKEQIRRGGEGGSRFAKYAMAYYGGTDTQSVVDLFKSDGNSKLNNVLYKPVISRLYDNIRISRYASDVWSDINFLRLLLFDKYFPLENYDLPVHSCNALIIICQKALHSPDPFVVREAERLLTKVSGD